MAASDIRAGKAFVELTTKLGKGFDAGLNAASKKLQSWGSTVSKAGLGTIAAGSALLAPLALATKMFTDMGSQMVDASARTGVGVKALSELAYAAEQTGTSFEDVEIGLKRSGVLMTEAAHGGKEAQETLQRLGLTIADLANLSPDEQFSRLAEAITGIQNPTERAAMAVKLFGKSGTILLPMIKDLDTLREHARALGIVMSKEDAEAADRFGDSMADLWAQIKAVSFQAGSAIVGVLQPWANAAAKIMAQVIGWTKANKGLVVTIGAIGVGLVAAGGALVGLGAVMTSIGVVLGGIATAVAFVFSPAGLLIAGVVAAGVAVAKYTNVIGYLKDTFGGLGEKAVFAFSQIADALREGDLKKSVEVFVDFFKGAWIDIKDWAKGIITEIAATIKTAWITAWSEVQKYWMIGLETYKSEIRDLGDYIAGIFASDEDKKYIEAMKAGEDAAAQNRLNAAIDKINAERDAALGEIDARRAGRGAGGGIAGAAGGAAGIAGKGAAKGVGPGDMSGVDAALENFFGPIENAMTVDIPKAIKQAGDAAIPTRGLFNIAGGQSLQGGGPLQQAAIDTAKNTRELLKLAKRSKGLTFTA